MYDASTEMNALTIEDLILLNRLAQRIDAIDVGLRWFRSQGASEQSNVLRQINYLIMQARPIGTDVNEAIEKSGLKSSYTPCVMLRQPGLGERLAKVANLPAPELEKAFQLLIALLGVADQRRRTSAPLDLVNHLWHRDLSNPNVLAEIKGQRSRGEL